MAEGLGRRLAVARGDEPADLVLRGGRVLSVFTGELLTADVAICDEHVAAVGPGYEGTVFLANPGEDDATARVTEVRPRGSASSTQVTVPAGTQVALQVDASRRSSSTFVEAFGGWVAAGWQIRGGEGELGLGTEPCAADAGTSLVTAGATTGAR